MLAEVRYVEGTSSLQIKPLDIKNRSIYFKNHYLERAVELGRDLILVGLMVVHEFKVVREVQNPHDLELTKPIKVPMFCIEKFPFVVYCVDDSR